MTKQTEFTAEERDAWVPPDCPRCGSNARVTADWKDVSTYNRELYVLGLMDCPCQREQIQASIFG